MKQFFYALIAVVAALVIWRGLISNAPQTREESQKAVSTSRGRFSADNTEANFESKPAGGNYPPRALGLAAQSRPPSDSWLLDAESDYDRFHRLEVVLRGADIGMFEIGIRFAELHRALSDDSFDLAVYETDQIVRAANIALLKQPGWKEARGEDYLGREQWVVLDGAVKGHNGDAARQAFLGVRQACMTCHTAHNQDFLNRSDVFGKTAGFPVMQAAQAKK